MGRAERDQLPRDPGRGGRRPARRRSAALSRRRGDQRPREPLDLGTWLAPFRASEACARLAPAARRELDGLVRVLAWAWPRTAGRDAPASAEDLTAEAAVELLIGRLPREVTAVNGDAVIEAAVRLLEWAAKTGRVPDRKVEAAVRRARVDACAAMASSRGRSPGKEMASHALRDGIDVADLGRLREHAIGTGLSPAFVDEFLPPPPVSLGDGRWLYLREPAGDLAG